MKDADDCENYRTRLHDAARRIAGGRLPPLLQVITDRHIMRLELLVEQMRAVGIDENLIRHSVREIVASYENELLDATLQLSEGQQ